MYSTGTAQANDEKMGKVKRICWRKQSREMCRWNETLWIWTIGVRYEVITRSSKAIVVSSTLLTTHQIQCWLEKPGSLTRYWVLYKMIALENGLHFLHPLLSSSLPNHLCTCSGDLGKWWSEIDSILIDMIGTKKTYFHISPANINDKNTLHGGVIQANQWECRIQNPSERK